MAEQEFEQGKNAYIIDIEGDNGIAEVERLKRQGYLVTKAIPLLPAGYTLKQGRVVDLACGAGEWCLHVADVLSEQVEVIGVDLNDSAIQYCNELAAVAEHSRLEFLKMDILQPLAFEDESCDLVNARLLTGILPCQYWDTLLGECYRILKPGGMVRLIEPTCNVIEGAPSAHEFNVIMMRTFYQFGKTFSEHEYGVAAALNRLFHASPFVDVQQQAYFLDCSAWAPLFEPLTENFILSVKMLKPLVLAYGGITEEHFEALLALSMDEMYDPQYANLWGLMSFQARKPA